MKHKGLIVILSGLGIFMLIVLLLINPCDRLKIREWNHVVLFSTLNGATKTTEISEKDASDLKGILDNRYLYFEEYSCGFSDNFGISIDGKTLWIAEDGCPHLYDCTSGKFFSISAEQRKEILFLFSKYGLYAPKY